MATTGADLALAEPAACNGLRQQLAAASSKGRSGAAPDSRAIQQAAINLQQSRGKARQAGCSGSLFSRSKPAQCQGMERQIAKQAANLDQLKRGGSGRANSSDTARIASALKANGCAPQRKSFLEVLFGKGRESPVPQKQAAPQPEQKRPPKNSSPERVPTTYDGVDPVTGASVKKGYRTLCVRICDGYYFPISFSTKSKFFVRDQNACTAMCPAGNAQLYYHAVPEQESDDMISVAGKKPYSELPHAFNYRTAGVDAVPGCTCQSGERATGVIDAFAEETINAGSVNAENIPALALVPRSVEKGQNNDSAFAAMPGIASVQPLAPGSGLIPETERQNVRMVGPAFLPDKSDAMDFRSLPREVPVEKEVSTRFTAETVIETISTDILRRIRE
ncbi:DUF2865 domain-containing protein [Phyllobacterium sp. CCNWLW183]|uniref:DUF2865 domain-containing protein n=1 Tax=Phyllobacterium sp. CCNWLW183 TaxID=3127482 RepID=UPI003077F165